MSPSNFVVPTVTNKICIRIAEKNCSLAEALEIMRVWWLAVPVLCLVLLGIIWKYFSPKPRLHLRTLVVLGSGGHTGEMFKLLEVCIGLGSLPNSFRP